MSADVVCSGWYWNDVSSLHSTPMRSASSSSPIFTLSSRSGTRRVAERVAAAAVLLTEQPGDRRPVLVGEAPLLTDAAVPQLGERLGHLDAEAVHVEVVGVLVLGEQLGGVLATRRRPS